MPTRNVLWALKIAIIAIGFSLAACSTSPVTGEKSRLIISFYSIAGGPDRASQKRVDAFLEQYEKSHTVTLAKNVVHWGREGEFDYCLPLSELNQADQKTLVSDIRAMSDILTQVDLYENEPCKESRNKQ